MANKCFNLSVAYCERSAKFLSFFFYKNRENTHSHSFVFTPQKPARTKRSTPKSSKKRIADHLGMKKPTAGKSIPTVKEQPSRTLESLRYSIGVTALSITGNDGLDLFV